MSTALADGPVFEELHPPLTRTEALLEADRCLECGGPYAPAPCMVACPAGVDVAQFVGAIAADDPAAAAETIFAENLLGATLRAGVPCRGPVRGRLRAHRIRTAADRDRRAAALRDRSRARSRRRDPRDARLPTAFGSP